MELGRPPRLMSIEAFQRPCKVNTIFLPPPQDPQDFLIDSLLVLQRSISEVPREFRDSLQFYQPGSLVNSIKHDLKFPNPVPEQSLRMQRLEAYRAKKRRRGQINPCLRYHQKHVAASHRYRINGRFISEKERVKLAAVLPADTIFNANNNLNIELVSRCLNVIKTPNQFGYAYIRKEEILKRINKLLNGQRLASSNRIKDRIAKGQRVFYLVSDNQVLSNSVKFIPPTSDLYTMDSNLSHNF